MQLDFERTELELGRWGESGLDSRRDRWLGQCFLVVCSSLRGSLRGFVFKCGDLSSAAWDVGE